MLSLTGHTQQTKTTVQSCTITSSSTYHYAILRVQVVRQVILPIPKPVISVIKPQCLKLLPHLRIAFLDPSFDVLLSFNASGRVEPVAKTGLVSVHKTTNTRKASTHISRSSGKPYSSSTASMSACASSCWWFWPSARIYASQTVLSISISCSTRRFQMARACAQP